MAAVRCVYAVDDMFVLLRTTRLADEDFLSTRLTHELLLATVLKLLVSCLLHLFTLINVVLVLSCAHSIYYFRD
ncbi:hypothetical protein DZ860_06545 [Vibrio sinensis]|uniref:Uncharacterized protein n=1 Tax=Vibrio sinensis TaxID=2302434 RepID=A0A3A6R708_9VIBR|nr:hypothetical protein DZ860_06545 [Vibrio sinensis]